MTKETINERDLILVWVLQVPKFLKHQLLYKKILLALQVDLSWLRGVVAMQQVTNFPNFRVGLCPGFGNVPTQQCKAAGSILNNLLCSPKQ